MLSLCFISLHFKIIFTPTRTKSVNPQSIILHERLLNTVMAAPLSFFTSTDVGTTLNRFSQDMTVIDTELPDALIDLTIYIVVAVMGAIL